ncbi:uncharacterized protein BDW47DRAFT_113956 [Aspergillus candidus]|uniref:Uncharacterized protein n=1 Tax=Aspergillus candidus TaxID=41067 RepID=A0A2I2EYH1_ASPCN|nr:hypothetical protein BDW47DRAFT_113956 [Aspergillus candidus]PLB33423.1 hypothetical protein BDW47DRAFT_113956 [Aspergillus candidus]
MGACEITYHKIESMGLICAFALFSSSCVVSLRQYRNGAIVTPSDRLSPITSLCPVLMWQDQAYFHKNNIDRKSGNRNGSPTEWKEENEIRRAQEHNIRAGGSTEGVDAVSEFKPSRSGLRCMRKKGSQIVEGAGADCEFLGELLSQATSNSG